MGDLPERTTEYGADQTSRRSTDLPDHIGRTLEPCRAWPVDIAGDRRRWDHGRIHA
jgi:hypothetical protein